MSPPVTLRAFIRTAGVAAALCFVGGTALAATEPYREVQKRRSWFSFMRPAKATPQEQMAYARALRAGRHVFRASRHYRALVSSWPSAPEAPVAQREIAEMLDARGWIESAFDQYQLLVEKYPDACDFDAVIARQYALAERMRTVRHAPLLFGGWKTPERAIPLYERIVLNAPMWTNAPQVQFTIGALQEAAANYAEASVAFQEVQYRYPRSPPAEEAAFRRARCLYWMSMEAPNDPTTLDEAWTALSQFARERPASRFASDAMRLRDTLQTRRVRAAYEIACYYDRHGRSPENALMAYERFLTLFPNTEWTPTVQQRLEAIKKTKGAPANETGQKDS